MQTITVEEAQSRLAEILDELPPGEAVVLTRDGKPVATIEATLPPMREPPVLGTLKGTILYIAPDFDEIPEGFEDYMP